MPKWKWSKISPSKFTMPFQSENRQNISSFRTTTLSWCKNYSKSVVSWLPHPPKVKLSKISPFKTLHPAKVEFTQNWPFQNHHILPKWKLLKSVKTTTSPQGGNCWKSVLPWALHPPKVRISQATLCQTTTSSQSRNYVKSVSFKRH